LATAARMMVSVNLLQMQTTIRLAVLYRHQPLYLAYANIVLPF